MESYSVQAVLSAVDKNMSSGFAKAASEASSFGSKVSSIMSGVGKSMMVAGAAIGAMGVKSAIGFGKFQQSLNQAAVIAGGTSKDIKGLSDVANEMGAVLPLSAQDAADAMVAMARDGASIDTIKKEFPAIAQAATDAGADLQTTASVVQQSMNIWGKSLKSPQQAAAILTQTANLSNASIEDMQQALATIGGTASNAGIDMKTTASAIGLLTNRGFSAAQASQDLNHAILQMQAPSQIAQGQIDKLGLSFVDAQGNMKPLPQILGEISDSMSNMTSSEKAAALKKMFGTSGMAAILPLMDSVKDKTDNTTTSWDAFTKKMDGATDSTQTATKFLKEQADEMQKNLGSKIEQVGGNWEALSNKAMAGSAGVTGAFLDMTNSALEWAGSSNSSVAGFIRQILGLTPVIGGAVTATGAFLTSATKIGSTMAGAAKFLISPWGIALVGVMALVGGLVYAYNHFEAFHKSVDNIGKSLVNVFGGLAKDTLGALKGLLMGLQDDFKQIGKAIDDNFGKKLKLVDFSGFASKASITIQNLIGFIGLLATNVTELTVAFINTGAIQKAWNMVGNTLKSVSDIVKSVLDMLGSTYNALGKVGGQGSTIGKILQTAFGAGALLAVPLGIKLLPKALRLVLSPVNKLGGAFSDVLGQLIPFGNKTKEVGDKAGKSKRLFSGFASGALKVGAGVGIAAAGLGIFAGGIAQLVKQGEQGTETLTTFALAVGVLTGIFAMFGSNFTAGALGIGVLLGGLTTLALAFTALAATGKQGQATMITFALAISGVVAVFAVFSPLLTSGAVGMVAFGAAVLAVGAGVLLFGTGINLAAQAIALLATNISAIIPVMTALGIGFAAMITGFLTSVMAAVPQITLAFFTMFAQILTQAVIYVPQIVALFMQMVSGFLAQLITYAPQIAAQFITLFLSILTTVTSYVPQIVAAITNMLIAMMNAVAANAPLLIAAFVNMVVAILGALTAAMPRFIAAGVSFIVSILEGVASNIGRVISAAVDVVVAFINGVASNLGKIINAGINLLGKFVLGIVNAIPKLASIGVQAVEKFIYGVGNALGQVLGSGHKLLSMLVQGIVDGYGKVTKAGQGSGKAGADGARGTQGLFQSAGSFIGQGLVNGIKSMAGSAMSAAASIASQAAGAIKKALKIHSPSRVTYGFGGYFGAGFINGIKSTQKQVGRVAGGMGDLASNALNSNIQALNANVSGSYNGSLTMQDSSLQMQNNALLRTIAGKNTDLYLDGNVLVGGTANRMDNALGNNTRLRGRLS